MSLGLSMERKADVTMDFCLANGRLIAIDWYQIKRRWDAELLQSNCYTSLDPCAERVSRAVNSAVGLRGGVGSNGSDRRRYRG